VVLLDEWEKAHPDVHNLFLAVFDEGQIRDNQGREIDCSNALFILTSNLELESIPHVLRPELRNRLTDVVQFAPLGTPELARILDRLLADEEKASAGRRESA
jgi:ATP-dependent Clp protease ATP-binding subunit ClpA